MSELESDLAISTHMWNALIARTIAGVYKDEPLPKEPPKPPTTCPQCESMDLYDYDLHDCGHYTDLRILLCSECGFAWNPDHKDPEVKRNEINSLP